MSQPLAMTPPIFFLKVPGLILWRLLAKHVTMASTQIHLIALSGALTAQLQVAAIERATALMLDICGGNAGPVVVEESAEHLPAACHYYLRDSQTCPAAGVSIGLPDVDDMLVRLGLTLVERNDQGSTWVAPSWRFDLTIEQDLVEEVARIYGYNNLPTSTPTMALELQAKPERQTRVAASDIIWLLVVTRKP